MKDCKQIEDLLEAYADGELNKEQAALVAQHVANCPHCKALLDEYLALNAAIADCAMQAPEDFAERVMAAVDREKAVNVKPQGRGVRLGKIAPFVGIGVAAMLCLSIASSSLVKFVTNHFADPDISVETSAGELLDPVSPADSVQDESPTMQSPTTPEIEQEGGSYDDIVETEAPEYDEPTLESPTYEETAMEGVESVTNAPPEDTIPPMEEGVQEPDSMPVQTEAASTEDAPTEAPAPETEVVLKPESVQTTPDFEEQPTEAPEEQVPETEPVINAAPENAANSGFFARIWQAVEAFIEKLWQAISRLFGGERHA